MSSASSYKSAAASSNNYYDRLGVSPNASEMDIKKAYRALSMKFHPDRNKDASAVTMSQEINEAYEILGDVSKRGQYDNELAGETNGPAQNIDAFQHMFSTLFQQFATQQHNEMNGVDNTLHHMFGNQQQHQHQQQHPFFFRTSSSGHSGLPGEPPKPQQIIRQIHITLEDAFQGCTIPIEITKSVLQTDGTPPISMQETIYVTVPPGINTNEIIILPGQGNVFGPMKGDIRIGVNVMLHDKFERQGNDLICKHVLTLKEALCGFHFEIKFLDGRIIQFENKNNHAIIHPKMCKLISQMGMRRDGNVGNLIIEFAVTFPESLTPEQIASLSTTL